MTASAATGPVLPPGLSAVLVIETTVCGVPAYHSECLTHRGWRCHRAAHEAEDTALRCAKRHAATHPA